MTPVQWALSLLAVVTLLWLAYKIGKVVLRVLAGLLFLGAAAFVVWYFFIRSGPVRPFPRSHHGSHFLSPVRG
ncbi:MAG: hypothetical protein HY823_15435 [Acidobacteria bacterium]|nr:hypothetical protein [Acidobacteriota bacterium]